jgi:hypothetical membrane protein
MENASTAYRPRRRLTGEALVLASSVYLVAEALAALRFSPPYSYRRNFISELGIPDCGAALHQLGPSSCSPLSGLMNAGFIVEGGLLILATALLFALLRGRRRFLFGVCGVVHGAGLILVGLFHAGGPDLANGRVAYHLTGASLAIFGGNLAIALAPIGEDLAAIGWIRRSGLALGAIGLLAGLIFSVTVARQTVFWLDYAVWERVSVYTIVAWDLLIGACLIWPSQRGRPGPISA